MLLVDGYIKSKKLLDELKKEEHWENWQIQHKARSYWQGPGCTWNSHWKEEQEAWE